MGIETNLLIKQRSGIVIPPNNIKKLADKTAEYVAKNGSAFEDIVMQKELSNPQFCFLRRDDTYRPYYENKISEYARGLVQEEQEEVKEKAKATAVVPLRKTVKAPPPDQFTVEQPRNLSALDLDIIKHTAIFIAKNGKKFLVALTEREKSNPQYDFLKPTHDLFQFFSNLVDAYTKCLQPKREEIDRLISYVNDKPLLLQKCLDKFEYEQFQKEERDRKQQQDEDERQQIAMIDWNDFSIAETIESAEDDRIDKVFEKETQRFDKMDFKNAEPQFNNRPQVGQFGQIEQRVITPKQVITLNSTVQKPALPDANVPIVKDYIRPTLNQDTVLIKCEICNKNFPKNQINEHIQLELQDPRYFEIKKETERVRNSAQQHGNQIADHLTQLKKKRPDIFEKQPPPPPPKQVRKVQNHANNHFSPFFLRLLLRSDYQHKIDILASFFQNMADVNIKNKARKITHSISKSSSDRSRACAITSSHNSLNLNLTPQLSKRPQREKPRKSETLSHPKCRSLRLSSISRIRKSASRPNTQVLNSDNNQELQFSEITKLISQEWNDLSTEKKQAYLDSAEIDRKRYQDEQILYGPKSSTKKGKEIAKKDKIVQKEELSIEMDSFNANLDE